MNCKDVIITDAVKMLKNVRMMRTPFENKLKKNLIVIPGLDQNAPYYSRLSARSALYTEFHLLLSGQKIALTSAEYRAIVLQHNCLARASVSVRRKLWKEIKARYRLESNDPLFAAFWTEWRRCVSESERGLTAYVLFALNDHLVTDLGTEWLFPLLRRAPAEIRVADVLAFIQRAESFHSEVRSWSAETRYAVSQKYTASIRDFGLAKGSVRKTTVRPALYGAPVRLLIRALRLAGMVPLDLVSAPAFRLLGLDVGEVIDALGELNRIGALRFRMQGDVIELDIKEAA
jgi:hypothetical protein